jgi:hypothetical protein
MAYEIAALGGGNACGYLAKELVALGLQPGKLAIITDEAVSTVESSCRVMHAYHGVMLSGSCRCHRLIAS